MTERWRALLPRAFYLAAVLLVPWSIYLLITLPRHYETHHYRLGWMGFDVMLAVVLLRTGQSLARGHTALARYAAVAATMLTMDAWFNVVNANTLADILIAAAAAILVELPLAYLCWQLARAGERLQGPPSDVEVSG